jgi:hypothetical protein
VNFSTLLKKLSKGSWLVWLVPFSGLFLGKKEMKDDQLNVLLIEKRKKYLVKLTLFMFYSSSSLRRQNFYINETEVHLKCFPGPLESVLLATPTLNFLDFWTSILSVWNNVSLYSYNEYFVTMSLTCSNLFSQLLFYSNNSISSRQLFKREPF